MPAFSLQRRHRRLDGGRRGLLALIVYGLLPLRASGDRLLPSRPPGLPSPSTGHLVDVVALSDLGKILLGTALGFWLGAKLAELTGDVAGWPGSHWSSPPSTW